MADVLRPVAQLTEEDLEEIRLALVMTGGSSLAVWMGGVTNEVNCLRLGQGAYGQVLEMLHATARIDVISGTSAGGLNGAIMGMAVARAGSSLDSLRTLWQQAGSFEKLFRDPFEADPPSLLQGDAYFLTTLREAIEELAAGPPTPPDENPVELIMTGSLLAGRDSASADDFGSLIVDSDHKAEFRFRRGAPTRHPRDCAHQAEGVASDDFAGRTAAGRLALAARSSASFPVVFEPSFVPIGDDDATPERPNMRCNANFPTSRYVLDGGVLMNKPIEPALRAVFDLPARRQVRRVLAYVVPDPGNRVIEPRGEQAIPTVARVALASLVTLPRNESIAGELDELRRHNERARLQRDARYQILLALQGADRSALAAESDPLEAAATRLYPAYVAARVRMSVSRILEHVAEGVREVAAAAADAPLWNVEHLRSALETHRRVLLPPEFPSAEESAGADWRWGVETLEHVGAVVLDLLRRPLRMTNPRRTEDPAIGAARSTVMAARGQVHERLRRIREIRDRGGRGFWPGRAGGAIAALADPTGAEASMWAEESFRLWPDAGASGAATKTAVRAELGEIALVLAQVLVESAGAIEVLTRESTVLPGQMDDAVLLRSVMQAAARPAAEPTLRKLLALHVVETVFGPGQRTPEQVVELIQVSGNTPNGFDGRAAAVGKIAGVKLGHFAAFYKSSWRANDWMWGRLDGAYRLTQMLLDPARLRQLEYSATDVLDRIEEIALGPEGSPEREVLADGSPRGWDRAAALAELAFLGDGGEGPPRPLPSSLPVCARSVARRIQLEILCSELPEVAGAVETDRDAKAYESPETIAFAREVRRAQAAGGERLRPKDAERTFRACAVGNESVEAEMGSDLFAATASTGAAVTTSIGQGTKLGVAAVRGAFKFVRGIVIAIYLLAQNALRGGAFGNALVTLMLATGAICVAASILDKDGSPTVRAVGIALVGGGFLWAALRATALRALWALAFTAAVLASPEIFQGVGSWLTRSGSTWAGEGFSNIGDFAARNRAATIMVGLFLGPLLLGLAGRKRGLEAFAEKKPALAWKIAAAIAAVTIAGLVLFAWAATRPSSIVAFEFAGSAERVDAIRTRWTPEELHASEVTTGVDYAFILGYVVVVSAGVSLAAGLRRGRDWLASAGRVLPSAVVLAGVLDAIENVVIFRLLGGPAGDDVLPRLLFAVAGVKFAIVLAAAAYVAAVVVAQRRSAAG